VQNYIQMAIIKASVLKCDRCGYQWLPRGGMNLKHFPTHCASKACHSPYWNSGPPVRKTVSKALRKHKRKR
jgi:hypothetical protein